ncbi:MAPEG family protein [Castellaniella hirudinis]|uniref:MAPEG family protein n=1 Tax=Castellaniella hirudinis TaxID=1144617 RepID=UPI0039C3C8BA
MITIPGLLLAAAVLPYLTALAAKAGGRHFDNDNPRAWLSAQQGWRARANAAQTNLFEGLPFYFAAVLYALHAGADTGRLATLMTVWLVLRILFVLAYILGRGTVRSLIWGACLVVNLMILFAA